MDKLVTSLTGLNFPVIATRAILSATLGFTLLFGTSTTSNAQPQPDQINQLIEKLNKKRDDSALREEIIKLAIEMKPLPGIPESAREHFVEGATLTKAAKDINGQKLAVESFQKALLAAPWWGDAYYNLAVAQELAGQFDDAQNSLKFYILTKPGEKEAREAQDRIYELKAKKKLADAEAAQKEAARKAADDTPEARERRFFASLEGAVFFYSWSDTSIGLVRRDEAIIMNRQIVLRSVQTQNGRDAGEFGTTRVDLTGRVVNYTDSNFDSQCNPITLTISEDGRRMTHEHRCYGRTVRYDFVRTQ